MGHSLPTVSWNQLSNHNQLKLPKNSNTHARWLMTAQDHLPSSRHGAKELTEEKRKKKKKKNQISHRRLWKCSLYFRAQRYRVAVEQRYTERLQAVLWSREKPAGSCGSPSEISNYPHQASNRQPDLNLEAKKGRNKTQALHWPSLSPLGIYKRTLT